MFIILIRTIVIYIFVTVGVRLMGKRQIGDMQPNELVVTLLISEIAAIPLQDMSQPVLNGIIAILMLVVIEILVSIIALKSHKFRKIMNGSSIILIKNGKIDQKQMRNVRMTNMDLIELLRLQSVFDISTVEYAVLEVNGGLSVLLKNKEQTITRKDLDIKSKPKGIQLPVISDGNIVTESLDTLRVKEEKIFGILNRNMLKVENIFLMTLDIYDNFCIVKKDEK